MNKVKLELSYDTIDHLLIDILKDEYISAREAMKCEGPFFHPEDIKSQKKVAKAAKTLLRYYMPHEEYKTFIEENKK